MRINNFKLEEYLTKYEFSAPYLLCCSDAESFSMHEIIQMADASQKRLWEDLRLGYTEVAGLPLLRQTIVKALYPGLNQENILCFAGAEEGIFCALSVLCGQDDHGIVLTPCYQSLLEIPKCNGASITTIELKEENAWRIDVEAIKREILPNTKCVVINFPHNPTGQVITESELNDLIAVLDQHGIWLFSDEVYRLLGMPEESWASPAAVLYPRALSLGVMSKAFGMAGLRVGWIACQDKALLKKLTYFKHYTSICNSGPAEIISLITLSNKNAILERNNNIVAQNLMLLDEFFAEYGAQFSWIRPQGGCVGFVRYRSEKSVDDFCENLVEGEGVLLMPASIYDYYGNYFRIGFGRKNMKEALEKLKGFMEKHEGSR